MARQFLSGLCLRSYRNFHDCTGGETRRGEDIFAQAGSQVVCVKELLPSGRRKKLLQSILARIWPKGPKIFLRQEVCIISKHDKMLNGETKLLRAMRKPKGDKPELNQKGA